jgi:hypothetical protein
VSVSDEELIAMMAVTVRVACGQLTDAQLAALSSSVAQAAALPAKPGWDRKAIAHAEALAMLGDVTREPALIRAAGLAAGWTYDLALAAGLAADGIILASRRRLLHHLRLGDAGAAEQEIDKHLRVLSVMARLSAGGTRPATAAG